MYQICEKIRVKAAKIKGKRRFRAKKALKLLSFKAFFVSCGINSDIFLQAFGTQRLSLLEA